MDILADLNSAQKEAVTHKDGPLLIIAGAGTGKTAVITRRIAYIIAQKWAKPSEILALTFTEKAAGEMETRVDELVPYGYVDMWVSTFHAFGDRIIRENAVLLGLSPEFKVLTHPEQAIFIRDHLFTFGLNHFRPLSNPTKYIEALLTLFSRLKDEDINANDFQSFASSKLNPPAGGQKEDREEAERLLEVAHAYEKYQELMAESGNLDFGDQVVKTLELFRRHPKILKKYQDQFKYILVDEFQDTNFAQNELIKILAGRDRNIAVVADDDQSIYKFRGAAISNVLEFKDNFPDAQVVVLTENYRSTQPILDYAYRLIRHNDPDRLEVKNKINKRLKSNVGTGPVPAHVHCVNGSVEADRIAEIIEEKVKKGNYTYRDFAVLVRANDHAQGFIQALNYNGIPYKFSGGSGLYQRAEVRLLICFLRSLCDFSDSLSLYHLATSDIYKIQGFFLTPVFNYARRNNRHLLEIFRRIDEIPELSFIKKEVKEKIKKISEDMDHFCEESKNHTVGQLLYKFLKDTEYLKKLTEEKSVAAEIAIGNIAKFFGKISEFEHVSHDKSALKFNEYLEMMISAGEDPSMAEIDPDLDAVNILTVHAAKGLEFPVVFLVNLVTLKFPVRKMPDQIPVPEDLIKETLPFGDWHLAEERRLFYVGMTRAQKELYLTSAEDYGDPGAGGKRPRKVSQFVLEAMDTPKINVEKLRTTPLNIIKKFEKTDLTLVPKNFYNGGLLKLSPQQIDDYLSCPLKFKYIHLLRVPLMEYHPVVYGRAIHQAIEEYFNRKILGQAVSSSDLISAFLGAWKSEGFITREHEEKRLAAGQEALTKFYEDQEKSKHFPIKVEEKFTCDFAELGVKISGRLDAVYEDNQSASKSAESADKNPRKSASQSAGSAIVEIRDFKTSEVKDQEKANERVKQSRQLSIYALAYKQIEGHLPDKVSLYFIESGLIGEGVKTEKDLQKTIDEIKEVTSGIKSHNFAAKPKYTECQYCAYSSICPFTLAK